MMRGGYLHNRLLVEPVAARFEVLGAVVHREHHCTAGYMDLLIEGKAWRIACEAELRAARVGRDLAKAVALQVDLLLLVVPTRRVALLVEHKLERTTRSLGLTLPPIVVIPLGALLQRLAHVSRNDDTLNVLATLSQKLPGARSVRSVGSRERTNP